MKLANRMVLLFVSVIALGSVIMFGIVRLSAEKLLHSFVYDGDRENAQLYAITAADYYRANGGWAGIQDFLLEREGEGYADRVTIADEQGYVVADTGDAGGSFLGTMHPGHHVAKGVPVVDGESRIGTIMVGSMVDSSLGMRGDDFLSSISWALFAGLAIAECAAFLIAVIFSWGISRPLSRLSRALSRVTDGDLKERLSVSGKDEVALLGSSFNRMADRLETLEDEKKRIIADAAHELRTPVTLIRGTIEAMIDGVYPADAGNLRSVHDETIRLSRLIETLEELQLLDSGRLTLRLESVDLGLLAEKSVSLFRAAAKEKNIAISVSVGKGLSIRVDALRIEEVLYNLLSNALRYTPASGRIGLTASFSGSGNADFVSVTVEDSGPGIPEAERERVFDRFYRLDPSRSTGLGGRGLGLSIAREIARSHGGDLVCGESVQLGGAFFVLTLPL